MDHDNEIPAAPAAPRPAYPPVPYQPTGPAPKSPLLAAFFSFLLPGLGQIYVGLYQRAMIIFAAWVAIFSSSIDNESSTEMGVLVPLMVFVWLFNVFDAYRQATFAVWGEPEEIKAAARERGKSGLTFGIALFALGLYGLLRKYFEIDLSFLLDHWYLVVMVVGGWLIWQAVAASRATAE
jgi:hypothetical protein